LTLITTIDIIISYSVGNILPLRPLILREELYGFAGANTER